MNEPDQLEFDSRPVGEIIAEKFEKMRRLRKGVEERTIETHGTPEQNLDKEWEKVCPPAFRHPTADDAPVPRLWNQVQAWGPPSRRWLGLIDARSGVGKTTCAFEALRHYHRAGYGCHAISAERYANACLAQFDNDPDRARRGREQLDICRGRAVLLLDDLGHERVSPRVEAEFKSLLDHRSSFDKPIIWTSNFPLAELALRFTEDESPYIIRRLEQFSTLMTTS